MERKIFTILIIFIVFLSCQKEETINPFDTIIDNQDTVKLNIVNADPNSIAGIYQNILKPTCANIGCHDGSFEPDYRTIESSFNTLVFQVPIKDNGNYDFRVEPFKPESSVIMARLQNIIGPQMPFTLEPDSDWPDKKDEYIGNIRTWITNGARDMAGNIRQEIYPSPILLGAGAIVTNNWMPREGGTGAIQIQRSSNLIDFYFSFHHDFLDAEDLGYNKISFSPTPSDFDSTAMLTLEIITTPFVQRGFYGEDVIYTHRVSINPNTDLNPNEDLWYFRVFVQDDVNPVTEIPTDNGIYYIKNYMSFEKIN